MAGLEEVGPGLSSLPRPQTLAVPELSRYDPHSGIGRVLHSLIAHWGAAVRVEEATFHKLELPILRNFPLGVRAPAGSDLILLPQLTGADALSRAGGLPSVAIVHDIGILDFPGDGEGRSRLSQRRVLRSFWGLRHASRIVAISAFSHKRLLHHLPALAPKTTVIPNGVDALFLKYRRSRSEARIRLETLIQARLGHPILLYVGSEIQRKNIPLLLEVFRRIQGRYPRAQLIKVGGAGHPRWRERTLKAMTNLGLKYERDVVILEKLDDGALADCYRAADVFLSCSLYEGFGLPALEALAVGTPVVVTDHASFSEVVSGAGWMAAPNVDAFTRATLSALNQQPGDLGRERAKRFTWKQAAKRYLELFDQLLAEQADR